MATVSIIVPVYNTEQFLRKCIDSILSQTYTDWELILVNDGSKDNSGKICDEYKKTDKRIKVVHKPNGGVSSARNLGLSMAHGEYVCFIDADDWVEPAYLEDFQLDKIKADFYVSGASYDVYDKVYSQLIYTETFCRNAETIKEQFIRQHLDDNGYPWGKVYKLNLIRENELNFNASLSMNEDHIFVFQYYYLIDTLFIASSCKYHYTVFDNAGRKLSSKSVPFAKIKSTSLIFDKTLESLNEKWAFASADFIKLNQRFVYQKRLQGIAALVKEKNMSSIMDEINYWNSNSYKPQNKKEVLILSILKSHFPLDAVYIMLRLFFKIINSIPRNRKKLIFEDLSRRSNLV